MSLMTRIFAPLLLSDNEHPMQKQRCRLSTDTMKSLTWRNRRLPSPTRINSCQSVSQSVRGVPFGGKTLGI